MKAVAMSKGEILIRDEAMPQPGPGQVLVKSRVCGICGSDIHIKNHRQEVFDAFVAMGMLPEGADPDIMLGHEFSAEVVSYGSDTEQRFPVGTRVASMPILASEGGAGVGVAPGLYGAFSQYFILDEALLMPVPDDVADEAVALTEPLAVGLHAVNIAEVGATEAALVLGCGPIGLACIDALRRKGVKTIIASAPRQASRELAIALGATHIVDPGAQDEMAYAADIAGDDRLSIIECIGNSKLLPDLLDRAPAKSCFVIAGVHTSTLPINFAMPLVNEIQIRFSYYYTPEEYAQCLHQWSDGSLDWRALCTGTVGLDGLPGAFDALSERNTHVKVMAYPHASGSLTPLS